MRRNADRQVCLPAAKDVLDPQSRRKRHQKSQRGEKECGEEADPPRAVQRNALRQKAADARHEHPAERTTRDLRHAREQDLAVSVRFEEVDRRRRGEHKRLRVQPPTDRS